MTRISDGWRRTKLNEVVSIKHGYAFPGSDFSDAPGFPTLLTPGNFAIGGGFKSTKPKTFTADYPRKYELSAGDLVVSMTDLSKSGDTLGALARVPADGIYLHNQRIGLVEIHDTTRVDKAFLEYALRTAEYRAYIVGTASGSTVRHTSPTKICEFSALLPPIQEQQAIAEVLGALDDKIAANRKLTETADQLAQALFAESREKPVAHEASYADLAAVSGGGTPRTSVPEYWCGQVQWATPTDVTGLTAPYLRSTSRTITEDGLSSCSSSLYPKGSILMTSRATIGAFAFAETPLAVNQGFIVVNAKDPLHQLWLFHEMRSRVQEFMSLANGATFLELSRGKFKGLNARLPARGVLEHFRKRTSNLHGSASLADLESESLENLRDTLLPRLMSGALRVRDAERQVDQAI